MWQPCKAHACMSTRLLTVDHFSSQAALVLGWVHCSATVQAHILPNAHQLAVAAVARSARVFVYPVTEHGLLPPSSAFHIDSPACTTCSATRTVKPHHVEHCNHSFGCPITSVPFAAPLKGHVWRNDAGGNHVSAQLAFQLANSIRAVSNPGDAHLFFVPYDVMQPSVAGLRKERLPCAWTTRRLGGRSACGGSCSASRASEI